MLADLGGTEHGVAARLIPYLIALVNGLAPLIISLFIITPLWLAYCDVSLPLKPFETSILAALVMIFLLGVFLGWVSGVYWVWSGIRALLIGVVTAVLIIVLKL